MQMGEKIKRLRRTCGLSQSQLAAKSGLPCSTLQQIEQGRYSTHRYEDVEAIAKALGVCPGSLAGGCPNKRGGR